jgi:hypothetical protein
MPEFKSFKDLKDLKVKKSDEDIIDQLMVDTVDGKFEWLEKNDIIYTKLEKTYNDTKVELYFELSDTLLEDEYAENVMFGYEFQDMFSNMITLDIFMCKNNKKKVFVKRISMHQLKLSDLLEKVMPLVANLPVKNREKK